MSPGVCWTLALAVALVVPASLQQQVQPQVQQQVQQAQQQQAQSQALQAPQQNVEGGSCRFPGAPAHCTVRFSNESLSDGAVATYSCERGFELLGPSRRVCHNGAWAPEGVPFCVATHSNRSAPLGTTMPKKAASKKFRPAKRVREPRPNRSKPKANVVDNGLVSVEETITHDNDSSDNVDHTPSQFGSVEDLQFSGSDTASICSSTICDIDSTDYESSNESIPTSPVPPSPVPSLSSPPSSPLIVISPSPPPSNSPPPTWPTTHSLSTEECKELLHEVNSKLGMFLPVHWISMVESTSINIMLLSRNEEKAIQRRINYNATGKLTISVHGKHIDTSDITKELTHPGALLKQSVNSIVDYVVSVMNNVRSFEICSGADHLEYQEAWEGFPESEIDNNYFQECRYVKTLRISKCKLLVEPKTWRCVECNKVNDRLRKKIVSIRKEEADRCTANIHLSKKQSLNKMKSQKRQIDAGKKKIERLQEKILYLIKTEGMNVDEDLHDQMQSALESENLGPMQSLFLQQQLKAANCKNSKGMRWHPAMIQFALSIFLASPAAYNIMVTSGIMKLPSRRTLFDYSHVYEAKEGISMPVLEKINERLASRPELKFKWHTLMCDEMHISQKIVYHKGSGTVMGYVKLPDVDKALNNLQAYLDKADIEREVASKVLAFMVKGVANDVKEVIASFSVNRLSKLNLYSMTWSVISECERSGLKIIVMISDGNAVNRAFFKMNTPLTQTKSGIVFDTINKAAPSRPLYFLSDVPHLVKTIRNNFHNSRPDKKAKRCLTKNGQKIVWTTIIRLFNEKKDMPLRKSYKLNKANVFPDSYSCMKVGYAFQVLSKTVANDIQSQGWPGTSETVKFILKVNDVADCLNGAHSTSGLKTGNKLLAPYTSSNDSRFTEYLLPFLEYLEEWKEEVLQIESSFHNQTLDNPDDPNDSFHSLHDIHESATQDVPDHPAHKRLLCHQTLEGIEITIRGFIGAVKYLLDHGGVDFINARVFCQDPLEQFFSKQRQRGGGSNTPNLQRYMENARSIHLQRGLSVRKRTANTTADDAFQISNEKMPRRKPAHSRLQ